ncbi:MAG: conserved exported protein of unknown function [Nitrosopumilales archaeon]|nr:MAG: conserved exported protein of unknown function [Nitrosopumilales archaeon]
MKKIILSLLLVLILFPISSSFSQGIDKPSALGIVLTSFSPNYFKDDMGHTIILGEVENTKSFPITAVKIWVGFYDDINKQPLESAIGSTILDVIPPFSKSPYIIRSTSPNAAITSVSVNLLGFNSATPKDESLNLNSEVSSITDTIKISGSITNDGSVSSSETKIHLFFVDVFQPPRILSLSTIELEEAIEPGSTIDFEFDEDYDTRSVSYTLFAESANYNSNVASVEIDPQAFTKIITINDISMNDSDGNKLSGVFPQGTTINIESNVSIQYSSDQDTFEQPFVYYAQVKQSEKGFVEFIGKFEGIFQSTGMQSPLVEWTPQNKGLYIIETFVWDPNAVPLASKGPIMLVAVT